MYADEIGLARSFNDATLLNEAISEYLGILNRLLKLSERFLLVLTLG